MTDLISNRKPHNHLAGYICELRNPHSGGHTVIYDAVKASLDPEPGRYFASCETHSQLEYASSLPKARVMMKDPTIFCAACREIAGFGDGA